MPGLEKNRILQGDPNLIVTDPGIRPLALNATFNHMRELYIAVRLGPSNYKDSIIVASAPTTRREASKLISTASITAASLNEIQNAVKGARKWTAEDDATFTEDNRRLRSGLKPVTLYSVSLDKIN